MTIFRSLRTFLIAFCLSVALLPTSRFLIAQETSKIADSGVPGQVVRILSPRGTPPLEKVVLLEKDGTIVESAGFISFREERFALLPLGPVLEPGDYMLRGELVGGDISYIRGFTVLPREFRHETIVLDSSLSSLRTEQNDLQREEALEIQGIYVSFDEEDLYDELDFISPIDFNRLDYFRISSEYGDRRLFRYADNQVSHAIHTGIDLAARSGVPVRAAAGGRVILAKERIISGYSVVIAHLPGVYSIYFHLKDLDVQAGQLVEKGERIGSVGMSGLATGPHLHWEVRVNGVAVDPAILIIENESPFPLK